ncbi:MAG: hypothetical protein SGPRY_014781 [Prymnesium sp.]
MLGVLVRVISPGRRRAQPAVARSLSGGRRGALVDSQTVNRWMADESLVCPDLGFFTRYRLWMMLRLMRGFDPHDFLVGARHAYPVVCALMFTREWEQLNSIVAPPCLNAMKGMMDDFASQGQQIQVGDEPEKDFQVESAVISNVSLLEVAEDERQKTANCVIDVKAGLYPFASHSLELHVLQDLF